MSTMSPPPWSFFLIFNIILRPWISTQVYQGTRGRGCGKLSRMSFWSLLLAQRSLDNLTWSQWLCRRATPNSSHPRPTTLLRLEGKSTTKKLIANDVIKESDSPWASLFVLASVLTIKKPTKSLERISIQFPGGHCQEGSTQNRLLDS